MKNDKRRGRKRGDTLVEVMAALTIATIGVVGLGSMQGAIARSSRDSEEMAAALRFARTWLERVKRDAIAWTAPGSPLITQITNGRASSTTYFVSQWPETSWFVPVPMGAPTSGGFVAPVESPAANMRGVDVGARDYVTGRIVLQSETQYCALVRFTDIQVNPDNANAVEAMRATVRVWWTRAVSGGAGNYNAIIAAQRSGCAARQNNEFYDRNLSPNVTDIRHVDVFAPITYTSNGP